MRKYGVDIALIYDYLEFVPRRIRKDDHGYFCFDANYVCRGIDWDRNKLHCTRRRMIELGLIDLIPGLNQNQKPRYRLKQHAVIRGNYNRLHPFLTQPVEKGAIFCGKANSGVSKFITHIKLNKTNSRLLRFLIFEGILMNDYSNLGCLEHPEYAYIEHRENAPIYEQVNQYLEYCAVTRQMSPTTMRSKKSSLTNLIVESKCKDLQELPNDDYDYFVKYELENKSLL